MERTVLVKSQDWAYEEEWRLIRFNEKSGVRIFPTSAITGVVLGARISPSDRDMVLELARDRQPPLQIRQARVSSSLFVVDLDDA